MKHQEPSPVPRAEDTKRQSEATALGLVGTRQRAAAKPRGSPGQVTCCDSMQALQLGKLGRLLSGGVLSSLSLPGTLDGYCAPRV